MQKGKLMVLGGANCGPTLSGACYLVEISGFRILLDCGGTKDYHIPPDIPNPETIDLIYISHAHVDHIGALGYIASICPNARIYMTNLTRMLTQYQLDAIISDKIGANTPALRFNNEILVRMIMNRVYTVEENTEGIAVGKDGAYVRHTFFKAGHTPGASMILLEIADADIRKGSRKLLYTGDFADFSTQLTYPYELPKDIRPDTLILCATHADQQRKEKDISYTNATDAAKQAILSEMKPHPKLSMKISSPLKSLELVGLLYQMEQEKKIPRLPIFMDSALYTLVTDFVRISPSIDVSNVRNIRDFDPRKEKRAFLITSFKNGQYYGTRFDFSIHASYQGLVELIKNTNAKNVFVVHTPNVPDEEKALAGECVKSMITYTENGASYIF
ncbi:MAG: MBL fold metallo-hydrolase [Clostridia bacterium]|nr:MBL fold metallo-hydrolase [Clostridia bacterium]